MTERRLDGELDHYRSELATARVEANAARAAKAVADTRAEEAESVERGLESIVAGLESLLSARGGAKQESLPVETPAVEEAEVVSSNGHDDTPRGRDAVIALLMREPDELTPADLTKRILDLGWIKPDARNPSAAVRQAIKRLLDDGQIVRGETPNTYRLKLPGDAGEATGVAT